MEPDTAAKLAEAAAERSQAAADLADRRARDADRLTRWMVGIAIALAVQMMAVQGAVAELQSGQQAILEQTGPTGRVAPVQFGAFR